MLPFGIGFDEFLVIAIVVLLVVGPKKLPEVARGLGKGLRTVRRVGQQLRDQAEVDEIRDAVRTLRGEAAHWQRPNLERVLEVLDPQPADGHAADADAVKLAAPVAGTAEQVSTVGGTAHESKEASEDESGAPVPRLAGPAAAVAQWQATLPAPEAAPAPAPAPAATGPRGSET